MSRVAELLLSHRQDSKGTWRWLEKERPSKRDANKLLLASLVDYMQPAGQALANR